MPKLASASSQLTTLSTKTKRKLLTLVRLPRLEILTCAEPQKLLTTLKQIYTVQETNKLAFSKNKVS